MPTKEELIQKSIKLNQEKKFIDVVELLNDSILKMYNSPELYTERGIANWEMKKLEDSLKDCLNAINIDPNFTNAYNLKGLLMDERKDYDNAIEDFNMVIKLNPHYVAAYNNRGNSYLNIKKYDKAIEDFNKAIELNPGYTIGYYNRGRTLNNKKEYEKAIDDFNKAIELDNNYSDAYAGRGLAWYNKKEYDRAIEDYSKAIELNSEHFIAYNNRGITWSNKKNDNKAIDSFNKAIDDFNKAIELNRNYSTAYYNRGTAWSNKKEYDKAIDDFNKAIELDNNYSDAYSGRGLAWYNKKEYDRAIEDYNKAIELNPEHFIAYNNRGITWRVKKEVDKAVDDLNKALELNPSYPVAYHNRGNAWLNKKEYDKAIDDFNKAIELDNNYADAYVGRGLALYNKKKYDKAIDDYSKAIELNPEHFIAYNNRGIIWRVKKEVDNAVDDLNKALELNPNYSTAYYNRGLIWSDKKEYNRAIEDYNKAIHINPDYESAKYWRDRTKAILGENISTDEKKPDVSFYLFIKAVKNLPAEDKKRILTKCNSIMDDIVNKIRKHASNNDEVLVAHYSKLKVADILISFEKSTLRYYNSVYMNDPEEGKILLECFDDNVIKKSFDNGRKKEENNIYLGSFLPVSHEDDLVMWRTYGKDENKNEAMGCSIVLDSKFFDEYEGFLHPEMRKTSEDETTFENDEKITPQSLYRVLYYDKRDRNFVGENKKEIKEDVQKLKIALKELIKLKDKKGNPSEKNIAIDKIVYHIISELRHFFKSADYAFENELRVIQFASSESDNVKIDNNIQPLPKKLYIESSKEIQQYMRKIILGPKVPHPDQWMYFEAQMKKRGYKMELQHSECKFQ